MVKCHVTEKAGEKFGGCDVNMNMFRSCYSKVFYSKSVSENLDADMLLRYITEKLRNDAE